jgi:hypothetical protein
MLIINADLAISHILPVAQTLFYIFRTNKLVYIIIY